MAYADADDLVARFDAKVIGDMVADDGKTIAESDLGSDAKVTAALASASGQVNSAVTRGKRYEIADLTALTGDDLAFLKDIVCSIAYVKLDARKQYTNVNESTVALREEYNIWLGHLNSGVWIFGVETTKDAGLLNVDTITRVDIRNNWELWVDKGRGHIYPTRRTYKRR